MKQILCLLTVICAFQAQAQSDVVMKAMQDEMDRNIEKLQAGDNRPFYISYALSNARVTTASAMFGSLLDFNQDTVRGWNTRVMVGDYQVNDENFSDNQDPEFNYFQYPSVPKEEDYESIRRFFWITTNNIFEEASRLYSSKKDGISKYSLDYSAPDFDTTEVVTLAIPLQVESPDPEVVKEMVRSLSQKFSSIDELFASNVRYSEQAGVITYINSEGIRYSIPDAYASLNVSAEFFEEDGDMYRVNQILNFRSGSELMSGLDEISKQIDEMIEAARSHKESDLDNYYGPIIVTDELVAQLYSQSIVNKLTARRSNLSIVSEDMAKKYFENFWEDHEKSEEIGNRKLNVMALPTLTSYDGKSLEGSIIIDSEGVQPPDTLVMIRDGVIVNKFNGRTPAPKGLRSNGHNRNSLLGGNLSRSLGASVLKIDYDETSDQKELEAGLLKMVQDQELEYGLIISPAYQGGNSLIKLTKLFADGSRESVITDNLNVNGSNILRKIEAASSNTAAYNVGFGSRRSSIICSNALLIKDYSHTANRRREQGYTPTIPMPVRE